MSFSFFACDKAADHTFWIARENEAAGAADATAWVTPAAVAVHTFL
jgi:hypothetical protein